MKWNRLNLLTAAHYHPTSRIKKLSKKLSLCSFPQTFHFIDTYDNIQFLLQTLFRMPNKTPQKFVNNFVSFLLGISILFSGRYMKQKQEKRWNRRHKTMKFLLTAVQQSVACRRIRGWRDGRVNL
jgi:hypothetical protein